MAVLCRNMNGLQNTRLNRFTNRYSKCITYITITCTCVRTLLPFFGSLSLASDACFVKKLSSSAVGFPQRMAEWNASPSPPLSNDMLQVGLLVRCAGEGINDYVHSRVIDAALCMQQSVQCRSCNAYYLALLQRRLPCTVPSASLFAPHSPRSFLQSRKLLAIGSKNVGILLR